MALDISLQLRRIKDVSLGRVLAGFEDEDGKMQAGRIKLNGKIYEVKFLDGGTSEVRRNYQGIFGWFRNRFCHKDTTCALALQAKINEVLAQARPDEYRILSSTHRQLLGLLKSSTEAQIEVANYGFESNRTIVAQGRLVSTMNAKLKGEGRAIKFNKIDDYNRLVGISPITVDPRILPDTMKSIASGTLGVRIPDNYGNKFARQDLVEWKAFLQRPETLAKIDIPGKLYRYMHLPEGDQASKQTGWEASFARDKTAAMRSFVLKNLPYGNRFLSSLAIDMVAEKLTRYVDIYAIKDAGERRKQLREFFTLSNWLLPAQKRQYNDLVVEYGQKSADSFIQRRPLEERVVFNAFCNVLSYSFFRQTSKLGLDFFREKGTPVMFQFADYSGRSYSGREQELFQPEAWRGGETEAYREKGGAAITGSEMRHGIRMGDDTTIIRV